MKKIAMVMALAACVGLNTNAQCNNQCEGKEIKNSVEIGFNPFSQNFQHFEIESLKYRHFWGNNALRVTGGFGVHSEKDGSIEEYEMGIDSKEGKKTEYTRDNTSTFRFTVGYERHFNLCKRASMYVGTGIGYEGKFGKSREKEETNYKTTDEVFTSNSNYTTHNKNSYDAFVLDGVAGVEYNICKNLYLGMEVVLNTKLQSDRDKYKIGKSDSKTSSLNNSNYSSYETEITREGKILTTTTTSTYNNNHNTNVSKEHMTNNISRVVDFNLGVRPMITIGWKF